MDSHAQPALLDDQTDIPRDRRLRFGEAPGAHDAVDGNSNAAGLGKPALDFFFRLEIPTEAGERGKTPVLLDPLVDHLAARAGVSRERGFQPQEFNYVQGYTSG